MVHSSSDDNKIIQATAHECVWKHTYRLLITLEITAAAENVIKAKKRE